VGRAHFGAPVGVAYHAAGSARDKRSAVHRRLTPMATTQARVLNLFSDDTEHRVRRCARLSGPYRMCRAIPVVVSP
jgi:hypothetical protein